MTSNVLNIAIEARKRTLGPFSPSFNITQIIFEGLIDLLPDDIHLKVMNFEKKTLGEVICNYL